MPSDRRVQHFRSGVKNPTKEVFVYDDGKDVVVHIVDLTRMRVVTVSSAAPPPGVEIPVKPAVPATITEAPKKAVAPAPTVS